MHCAALRRRATRPGRLAPGLAAFQTGLRLGAGLPLGLLAGPLHTFTRSPGRGGAGGADRRPKDVVRRAGLACCVPPPRPYARVLGGTGRPEGPKAWPWPGAAWRTGRTALPPEGDAGSCQCSARCARSRPTSAAPRTSTTSLGQHARKAWASLAQTQFCH